MKRGPRAAVVAVVLAVTSSVIVGGPALASPPEATVGQSGTAVTTESPVTVTDTSTVLPDYRFTDILVDNAHRQVFISMASRVIVTDFDGTVLHTITGLASPRDLTLSQNSATVYVVEASSPTLGIIDTTTYQVTHTSLPETDCPGSVAFTGGKVWYSYGTCGNESVGAVGVYDPATGQATSNVFSADPGKIRALPDRPNRLFLQENRGEMHVYDVSTATPTVVVEGVSIDGSCQDATLIAGGDLVASACSPARYRVHATADLSSQPALPGGENPNSVAATPDGRFVAVGAHNWSGPDIQVQNLTQGAPGVLVRSYTFDKPILARSLAFTDTGRLFAVEYDLGSRSTLHVFHEATKFPTSVTLRAPRAVRYPGTVMVTGTLNNGPGTATVLSLNRSDRQGSQPMPDVPVAADGSFSFSHDPTVTGPVTYTLGYAGDENHTSAQAVAKVVVRHPFDVNGDGHADAVIGALGENLGDDINAGIFHVLYGRATGVTTSGNVAIHQDTAGVPGTPEDDDQLGWSSASGDFNSDGYADVAVSANAESVDYVKYNGMVLVFYGSATGLRTDRVTTLSRPIQFLFLGEALAAGDFNGDGYEDLAAGGAGSGSGGVAVYDGGPTGLSTAYDWFEQGYGGVPGYGHSFELFGADLAAGDVNGDGLDDLAIGAPRDWDGNGKIVGSVTVLYGHAYGLNGGGGAQRYTKDTPGVPGGSGSYNPDNGDDPDQFGRQVALADINGDRRADLAVTAPFSPVSADGARQRDAGTLTVLYSDGSRISTSNAIQVSQQTSGMPGTARSEDRLGLTMAAGDPNGDGRADLAVFSPGDGLVTVIPGGASGLGYAVARAWTQDSPGIPGVDEYGDWWGDSLRFIDVKGTGQESLMVGADGENNGRGTVTVIHSDGGGLYGTGAQVFSQDSSGIPGTAEAGDWFGTFF